MDLLSMITSGSGVKISEAHKGTSSQSTGEASSKGQKGETLKKVSFDSLLKNRIMNTDTNGKNLKYVQQTSSNEATSDGNDEEEKPSIRSAIEAVITELEIPAEQKLVLKKDLEAISNEEDAAEFLKKLEKILMQNGIGVTETIEKFAQKTLVKDESDTVLSTSLGKNTEQVSVDVSRNAASDSNFDDAMRKALKAQGFSQPNDSSTQTAKESFDKLMTIQDAKISKSEVKIAEIVKPQKTEALIPEEGNVLKTTVEGIGREAGEAALKQGHETVIDNQEKPEVKTVHVRDINKIADLVQYAKAGEVKKLTVQLMPKELGKLNIELVENAGKISAKITMESDQAKNLIVNNAESIRQQLEAKGIVLEKMEFFFAERDFKDGQEQQLFKKKGGVGSNNDYADDTKADEEQNLATGLYA